MTQDQIIAAITMVCALVIVGSGIVRRRMAPRSTLALGVFWLAIILLGMALARFWLAHHDWP